MIVGAGDGKNNAKQKKDASASQGEMGGPGKTPLRHLRCLQEGETVTQG